MIDWTSYVFSSVLHLPGHRVLIRLSRLDEARQRGIAAGRKTRLPTDQYFPVIFCQHDDDGVNARKMLRFAPSAFSRPTSFDGVCRLAAISAKAVSFVDRKSTRLNSSH